MVVISPVVKPPGEGGGEGDGEGGCDGGFSSSSCLGLIGDVRGNGLMSASPGMMRVEG